MTKNNVTRSIEIEIPAELQYLESLGERLREFLGVIPNLIEPEATRYNIELAVHEIAANIVNHAYVNSSGAIVMSATLSSEPMQINVTLEDTGCAFDPDTVQEPNLGELQEHGFGLFLVRHLMDKVEYQQLDKKNVWQLTKVLSSETI